jgi:signal transduction histidine kinase
MHPIVREEVLRIGTEAIRNACGHAGGSHLNIKLEYQQDFSLEVRDDGHGMEKETISSGKRGHFGLLGMRERADRIGGKLSIISASDGTKVRLFVPGRYIF